MFSLRVCKASRTAFQAPTLVRHNGVLAAQRRSITLQTWLASEISATKEWRQDSDEVQPLKEFLNRTGWKIDHWSDCVLISGEHGKEKIEIILTVLPENSADSQTQEDNFKVVVTKGTKNLTFLCCAHSEQFEIDEITIDDATEKWTIPFKDLEDEGKDLFYAYLEARNIESDIYQVIASALLENEQAVYQSWATKINAFL